MELHNVLPHDADELPPVEEDLIREENKATATQKALASHDRIRGVILRALVLQHNLVHHRAQEDD